MNANQSRFHSTGNDGLLNVFIMSMLPVNGLMWFQPADPRYYQCLGSRACRHCLWKQNDISERIAANENNAGAFPQHSGKRNHATVRMKHVS